MMSVTGMKKSFFFLFLNYSMHIDTQQAATKALRQTMQQMRDPAGEGGGVGWRGLRRELMTIIAYVAQSEPAKPPAFT